MPNKTRFGKMFEDDFKASVPDDCWVYRLRDNASSFSRGANTRFTSSNICDYIMYCDNTKDLFLIECKSTKSPAMSISMIRENQVEGLKDAAKHNLIAGFLVNFRNENNDTFFITIEKYTNMIENISKKSFNVKDLKLFGAIRVKCNKKRTRYNYDIKKMIDEIHI